MYKLMSIIVPVVFAMPALGADWKYRTKHDSFFDNEERTAILVSSNEYAASLTIYNDSKGTNFVMLSARQLRCFTNCTLYVKFDDKAPISFSAQADRVVAAAAMIGGYDRFIQSMGSAKSFFIRIPRYDGLGDIEFEVRSPFDPDKFNEARRMVSLEKQCQENAVTESYSDCMKRLGGR